MSYFCPTCSINLSCSKALKRHNNSKNHLKRLENNLKYVCHCGRTFTQSSNLYRHKKNCNQTQPETNTETKINQSEQTIQILQKENQEMREEMKDLKKQVEMLLQQTAKNNTTNNINNQTNNIENQNIIVVNSFLHEDTNHITDKYIRSLIRHDAFGCIPKLIQKIHFDPNFPQNHNVKITNKKLDYAEIVENNKWVFKNKGKVIDDLISNSYSKIDEADKDTVTGKHKERFDNFDRKYNDVDEDTPKPNFRTELAKEVDLVVINGTKEIHK